MGIEPDEPDVRGKLDLGATAGLGLGDEVLDGGHHARLVEHHRAQPADQSPRLRQRPVEHLLPGAVRPQRRVEVVLAILVERLELHDGAGQLLGESVVDLEADQPAFSLLRFQELPEHPLLFAEFSVRPLCVW